MSFHTVVYSKSIGNTANTEITAATDSLFPVTNNHLLPPQDLSVLVASANSATMTAARVYTSSTRGVGHHHIKPLQVSSGVGTAPQFADWSQSPVKWRAFEEVIVDCSTGATEVANVVMHCSKSIDPIPSGTPTLVRFTSSTVVSSGSWQTLTTTFEDGNIPYGRSIVSNVICQSVDGLAARLIFANSPDNFRPGVVMSPTLGSNIHYTVSTRVMGAYGVFVSNLYPTIECYTLQSNNSFTGFLEVVRIG